MFLNNNHQSNINKSRRPTISATTTNNNKPLPNEIIRVGILSKAKNIADGLPGIGKLVWITLGALLFMTWMAIIRKQSLNKNNQASSLPNNKNEVRYIIAGPRYDQHFVALAIWGRLLEDANPNRVMVRIVAFPTQERFDNWLSRRKKLGAIPETFQGSACVFKGDPIPKFLGGISDLRSDASVKFLKSTSTKSSHQQQQQQLDQTTTDSNEQSSNQEQQQQQPSTTTTPSDNPNNLLPQTNTNTINTITISIDPKLLQPKPQVRFKNKIVTGYRAAEGKSFTNYRPFGQALTASSNDRKQSSSSSKYRNWQFLYQAPALASVVLVQDTTSAGLAYLKNKNSLINNIGWGGQSCLGGTKNSQIECRTKRALADGCAYDTLGIQPPQYRLWIREECEAFFNLACSMKSPESLWILKPSGGYHGMGMSVHKGCDDLRIQYPTCPAPADSTRRFVMEYLEPVLLDGHKFDVRSYVLIASMDPLMVFYHDGFVRRATNKYSRDDLKDKTAHITNAVQQDAKDDHFWDFKRLSYYLETKAGFPPNFMTTTFREMARHVSNFVFQAARSKFKPRKGKFQLFAVDWIVDSSGRSHMLEVNANPLVTNYPVEGFPQVWIDLMDLVMNLQASPEEFFGPDAIFSTPEYSGGGGDESKRFRYKGWELVFNELEEKAVGIQYNSCKDFQSVLSKQLNMAKLITSNSAMSNTNREKNSGIGTDDLDKIKAAIVRDMEDDEAIEQEEKIEDTEAAGGGMDAEMRFESCPALSVEDEQAGSLILRGTRVSNEVTFRDDAINCTSSVGVVVGVGIIQDCTLGHGTEDETPFRVINSPDRVPGPVVMVVAGMHGNEGAGIIAARHVASYWYIQKGVLIVIEKLNVRGVKIMSRLVPPGNGLSESHDLNRAFPNDPSTLPTSPLAKLLWRLIQQVRPTVLVDLHEARSYFAGFSKTHELVNANVGSTTSKSRGSGSVSKGNTIIASRDAEPLARVLANKANTIIKDKEKQFLILVPPIEGGLANRVSLEFHTRSLVCETTLLLPRETRVRHHLFFVSMILRVIGLVKVDFDFDAVGPPPDLCVSQTKKGGCAILNEEDDDTSSTNHQNEHFQITGGLQREENILPE
jgi:hypothetical protein